jgi:betaine-homocysteine S-methyltransferase
VHVAALPVPYRTHEAEPSFQSLRDPLSGEDDGRAFPTALDPFTCNRTEIARFAAEAQKLGVRYFGVCCGAAPHHIRAMAEALGRTPPASRWSADMSKHAYFGTDQSLKTEYQDYARRL